MCGSGFWGWIPLESGQFTCVMQSHIRFHDVGGVHSVYNKKKSLLPKWWSSLSWRWTQSFHQVRVQPFCSRGTKKMANFCHAKFRSCYNWSRSKKSSSYIWASAVVVVVVDFASGENWRKKRGISISSVRHEENRVIHLLSCCPLLPPSFFFALAFVREHLTYVSIYHISWARASTPEHFTIPLLLV